MQSKEPKTSDRIYGSVIRHHSSPASDSVVRANAGAHTSRPEAAGKAEVRRDDPEMAPSPVGRSGVGPEAARFAATTPGQRVRSSRIPRRPYDRYGRTLAYVELIDGGTLAVTAVAAGMSPHV